MASINPNTSDVRRSIHDTAAAAIAERLGGVKGLLTSREAEVLHGIAWGRTNREIGKALGISDRTVEIHRRNLIQKLAGRNSAEAVRIALQAGFVCDTPFALEAA